MLKAARFSVKVTLQGIEKVMAGWPFYRRTQLDTESRSFGFL